MKRILLLVMTLAFCQMNLQGQNNTLAVADTNLISAARWRDTCFGLIDKSTTQIPSGYLADYSLVPINDSSFNSQIHPVDTTTEGGAILGLFSLLTSSAVNSKWPIYKCR